VAVREGHIVTTTPANGEVPLTGIAKLRDTLRRLYHGRTPAAVRFQMAVIVIDLAIIAFFIATPVLQQTRSFLWIDYSVAAIVALDIIARLLASTDMLRLLRQPASWVDIFILATLLFPQALANLAFLRILRLWSLAHSRALLTPLEERGLLKWREPIVAVVNLVTFLFIVTGFVYTFFFIDGAGIEGYVDALYFTVTTITTTGYGDITLPGTAGKLTSIVAMIVGISLFVKLAQAVFRPAKVFFECPSCGLRRHEPDAVHCKACGHLLKIPDEGE
jgi:voltage-gated potassium channel